MNNQHNDIDLIESYLEGSLPEKELEDFINRIKTDTDFKNLVRKRKLIQLSFIEATERSKLKNQIRSVVSQQKRKSANQRRMYLIAASFISIMGIASFFVMQSKQQATDNLAKQGIGTDDSEVITSKENKIAEYGSVDTFNQKPVKTPISFLPPEGAIFQKTDTIWFFPHNINIENRLTITDKSGNIVKRVTLKPNQADYKVLPHILKPGIYVWFFSQAETVKHSFKIQ